MTSAMQNQAALNSNNSKYSVAQCIVLTVYVFPKKLVRKEEII